MAEDDLHQPNDRLFRTTFGTPENSAALLKATLPGPVAALVEWSKLQLLPGSFVDSAFRASHTDLLFSAPMAGREALIYVLLEHQSTRDRLLPLRLLRYMVRIWEQVAVSSGPRARLPAILPVVLSQNSKVWDLDPRFIGLLNLPPPLPAALAPFIPDFSFKHLQLAEMEFEAIPGTATGILVLRAMKAERLGRLLDEAVWDQDLILKVPLSVFQRLLRYMLAADVDRAGFRTKILQLPESETRSIAMTLAESLRQEGRQEALRDAVLAVLLTRFEYIPNGIRSAVRSVHAEDLLHSLHRAAIECPSLEAFAERCA